MKAPIIIFLLLMNTIAFGQVNNNIERLKNEATRIDNEIQIKTDSLKVLKGEITRLENQSLLLKFAQQNGGLSIVTTLKNDGKLRKSNSPLSDVITIVGMNDTVRLTDYQEGGYWIINKGQFFGYLNEVYINETEEMKIFKNVLQKQNEELRKQKESEDAKKWKLAHEKQSALVIQKRKEYRQIIINKYGNETGQKLLDGNYWIGMTDDMALISLGVPRSINKTVGVWGVNEQWVYYSTYLYFENGILTSYQNSR